ncbi:MAG: leucine-rich repeat domain-containing protein [Bacteroidaceae bacterium]|nr:leucine-rich repeat domain-containing protein [Bacteroidaceae bacterium]
MEAFSHCSSLASITVDEKNSIYDSRDDCNAIIETSSNTLIVGCQKTIIPNSVTTIGYNAFDECSNLTSIIFPNSVTTIRGSAFKNCSGLTTVTIPNSVKFIGDSAFSGCTSLTTVTIGDGVKSITSGCF